MYDDENITEKQNMKLKQHTTWQEDCHHVNPPLSYQIKELQDYSPLIQVGPLGHGAVSNGMEEYWLNW